MACPSLRLSHFEQGDTQDIENEPDDPAESVTPPFFPNPVPPFVKLLTASGDCRQDKRPGLNVLAWVTTSELSAVAILCWDTHAATEKRINLLPLKELSRLLTRALQCRGLCRNPGRGASVTPAATDRAWPTTTSRSVSASSDSTPSSTRALGVSSDVCSTARETVPPPPAKCPTPFFLPAEPTLAGMPKASCCLPRGDQPTAPMSALELEIRAARKIVACELIENNKLGFQASSGRVIWPHLLELLAKAASIMREHEGSRVSEGLAVLTQLQLTERLCWLSVHARLCLDFISTSWLLCQADLRYLAGRGLLFAPEFSWTSRFPVSCPRHLLPSPSPFLASSPPPLASQAPSPCPPSPSQLTASPSFSPRQSAPQQAPSTQTPAPLSSLSQPTAPLNLSTTSSPSSPAMQTLTNSLFSSPPLSSHVIPLGSSPIAAATPAPTAAATPAPTAAATPRPTVAANAGPPGAPPAGAMFCSSPVGSCLPCQKGKGSAEWNNKPPLQHKGMGRPVPPLLRSSTFPKLSSSLSASSSAAPLDPLPAPCPLFQPSRACLDAHAWLYSSAATVQTTPARKAVSATVSAIQSAMEDAESTSSLLSCDTNAHCLKCHPLAYLTQRCVFDCLAVLKRFEKSALSTNGKSQDQTPLSSPATPVSHETVPSASHSISEHLQAPEPLLSIIVFVAAFMPHLVLPAQQRVARLIVMHLIRKPCVSPTARAQTVRAVLSTLLITDPQILNEVLVAMHDHDKSHKKTERPTSGPLHGSLVPNGTPHPNGSLAPTGSHSSSVADAEAEVDLYLAAHTANMIDP